MASWTLIAAGLGAVAIAFRSGERLATRAADAERVLDGLI